MRTTITIDDAVFRELMRFTEAKSRAEAIHQALTEWIRRKKIEKLKALRGKVEIQGEIEDFRQLEIEETESQHG